jgi:sulfite reductase (NADPH) flavoprotein alpha-component
MSAQPSRLISPLSDDKLALLARLSDGLDADSLYWLSGYVAGVAASQRPLSLASSGIGNSAPSIAPASEAQTQSRLTIVYGTQTGNAKRQAETLARQVEAAGLGVRVVRADAYATRELANERLLYIVISTQGDGDPPDDSRAFVEFLSGKRAPKLAQLKFAVLGLGDSSYPQFCGIGAKLDARLAELGATRLFARGDADLDIASVAEPWSTQALERARELLKSDSFKADPVKADALPLATVTTLRSAATLPVAAPVWTRERPFAAPLLANQRISARNGSKDIRHIELSLQGAGLTYEPGDALGVWASNPPALVEAVVAALDLDGERAISAHNETTSLREWLLRKRELTRLTKPFLLEHARRSQHAALNHALSADGKDALRGLLSDYQLIDLLREFPARWPAEDLVAALRPLTPRMYSIASSRKAVGDEAHLTVALLDYEAFGVRHVGAASNHLAGLRDDGDVPVFIEANERFHVPADTARDVIMIGPGTGVAPFLYQVEWQQALKNGTLQRLDLAFSRDQSDKIYVQHTLRRRGRELYDWIAGGAHIYVCGDATRMAGDVDNALRDIIREHGGKSEEDARDLLNQLTQERRYARDVY